MFAEQTAEENANLPLVCIYVRGKGVNRSGQIAGRMGTTAGSCALQCCTHTLPWPVVTTIPLLQLQIFVATKNNFAAQFKNAGLQPRKCALLRDFAGLCKTRRQFCSWKITCGYKLVNCNCWTVAASVLNPWFCCYACSVISNWCIMGVFWSWNDRMIVKLWFWCDVCVCSGITKWYNGCSVIIKWWNDCHCLVWVLRVCCVRKGYESNIFASMHGSVCSDGSSTCLELWELEELELVVTWQNLRFWCGLVRC